MWFKPHQRSSNAASSWPPTPATSCSTRPAAPAPPPMSPSNGAGAGSPSTRRASPWRWPAPASWARAIRITCWPIPAKARSRKPRSPRTAPSPSADARQHPPRLRLRARAAHHAQVHRQQRRDRCHLGPVAGRRSSRCAQKLNAALKQELAGMGNSARGRCQVAGGGEEAARRLVAGTHRPAEGDRRLDRRQGRVRIPLRQALRRQEEGPRRRPVHRREPLAPPRAGRGRERRTDRQLDAAEGDAPARRDEDQTSPQMILENSRPPACSRRTRKTGSPSPPSPPGPASYVCAEGRYSWRGDKREKRAAIFIGPEFGTVPRPDLVPPPARPATPASTC